MPEIRENQPMTGAEQAEFDKAAAGHRERPFLPEYAKDRLADETAKTLKSDKKEESYEDSAPGVAPEVREMYAKLEKDPLGTLQEWISTVPGEGDSDRGPTLHKITEALREKFKDIDKN